MEQNKTVDKRSVSLFVCGLIGIAILLVLLVVGIPSLYQNPTSDNHFMLAHAKVIQEYGFVTTDVLRMHEGLHFIVPQWLFAFLFSFLYNSFGIQGYKLLGSLLFLLFAGSLFLVYRKFAWRQWKPLFLISISIMICLLMFNGVRPYWISSSLLILEALILSKMRTEMTSKPWSYILLGCISVLCINVHNSLWIGLILVWLTFFAESLIEKFEKQEPKFSFKNEFICFIILLASGLINPYGIKGILYIFTSMQSIKPFYPIIGELRPIWEWNNFIVMGYLLVVTIWTVYRWKKMTWHGKLLSLGFGFMGATHLRNIFLFLAGSSFAIIESYKGDSNDGKTAFHIALVIFALTIFAPITSFVTMNQPFPNESSGYLAVDKIEETNEKARENTTVFSYTTDIGSYLTSQGYRAYMDGCAELYGEENNGKKDYLTEFIEAFHDKIAFQRFVKNYMFDYILFGQNISETLEPLGYELVGYTKDNMKIQVGPKSNCYIFKNMNKEKR